MLLQLVRFSEKSVLRKLLFFLPRVVWRFTICWYTLSKQDDVQQKCTNVYATHHWASLSVPFGPLLLQLAWKKSWLLLQTSASFPWWRTRAAQTRARSPPSPDEESPLATSTAFPDEWHPENKDIDLSKIKICCIICVWCCGEKRFTRAYLFYCELKSVTVDKLRKSIF